jgi:hypothetical protein
MNEKRRAIRIIAIAALTITVAGCAGLNQDHFVPGSITPSPDDSRYDGSVNVQAFLPAASRGKYYLSDSGKARAVLPEICRHTNYLVKSDVKRPVPESCRRFMDTGEAINFVPDEIGPYPVLDVYAGPLVRHFTPDNSRGRVALFDSRMLRGAVEKAVAQQRLFKGIEQGDAAYLLNVWVIEAIRLFDVFGEGMSIDTTAIWRLTRVKDGKVLFCDFSRGHGASRAVGTNAYVAAMESATREMIQNGLSKLSGRSAHLAAAHIAGDWPGTGFMVPEGHRKMRENWSKLRKGMTEQEVRQMIPSMPNASCSIMTLVASGQRELLQTKEVVFEPCGWIAVFGRWVSVTSESRTSQQFVTEKVIFEPAYPFYKLTFANGVLERWEIR